MVILTSTKLCLLLSRLGMRGGRYTTGFVMSMMSLLCPFLATSLGSCDLQMTGYASDVLQGAWRLNFKRRILTCCMYILNLLHRVRSVGLSCLACCICSFKSSWLLLKILFSVRPLVVMRMPCRVLFVAVRLLRVMATS